MAGTECDLCGRPTGDHATVCTTCARRAHAALQRIVTGLAQDLDDALAGYTGAAAPHATTPEPRLPINPAVSDARTHLHATLVGWVRVIADGQGEQPVIHGPVCRTCQHPSCQANADSRRQLPADTLPAIAAWLARYVGLLRHTEYGPDAIEEILDAVEKAARTVDIPTRWIPLPSPCPVNDVDTTRPCGGALHYIAAPGLPIHGQIRCANSRDHVVPANRMIQFARNMRRAS